MSAAEQTLLEFVALVQKMRTAQELPSVRRNFLSAHDRRVITDYERACDQMLARLVARPQPPELDPLAVDPDPVGAPQVAHDHVAVVLGHATVVA